MTTNTEKTTIVIVDDQALLREGFRRLLELEDDFVVIGSMKDGIEAIQTLEQLANREELPAVVLMDIRMPHMNGIQATEQIQQRWPQIHVLLLTTFDDEEYIVEGIRAGAQGYLLKDVTSPELVAAIRAMMRGEMSMQATITAKLVDHVRHADQPERASSVKKEMIRQNDTDEGLTERETEVLIQLGHGASNREISETLFITEGTVKNHVSNILNKLGLRDRTQAAIYAREHGIV